MEKFGELSRIAAAVFGDGGGEVGGFVERALPQTCLGEGDSPNQPSVGALLRRLRKIGTVPGSFGQARGEGA